MGRVVIFTDDPGWHGKRLIQAFQRYGYNAEYVSLCECQFNLDANQQLVTIPGFAETLPDAAFVRGVPGGSLEEVVFYLDILHALKLCGIPVYNDGHAIERSVDKAMTSLLIQRAGLPSPATWVLRDREQALTIAERELSLGHKLISKPLFGSQGEGIRRLEKMTDLFWMTSSQGIYYLQRFIECQGLGYSDWRLFVINGKLVAAMRRNGLSWLNNVARGAHCEAFDVPLSMRELAVQATQVLAMDYAGVDLIVDRQGRAHIIEVNSIPAWKGLESVHDLNVAELLVADLYTRYLSNQSSIQATAV